MLDDDNSLSIISSKQLSWVTGLFVKKHKFTFGLLYQLSSFILAVSGEQCGVVVF